MRPGCSQLQVAKEPKRKPQQLDLHMLQVLPSSNRFMTNRKAKRTKLGSANGRYQRPISVACFVIHDTSRGGLSIHEELASTV